MTKRILLGGCDIPGWGGAATRQYQLFERMQRDGFDVGSVSLVRKAEEMFFRRVWGERFWNPQSLLNVHACILEEPLWQPHRRLAEVIESLAPDLLVGFGAIATVVMKLAVPRLPIVLMTIGSHQVQLLIEMGLVRDFVDFYQQATRGVRFPVQRESPEQRAVPVADRILVHSPIVQFALAHVFPDSVAKTAARPISFADLIYSDAEPFAALRKPFADRDIDLTFVASSWDRPIKNSQLVEDIVSRRGALTIHVVGAGRRRHPSSRDHGVVAKRPELYALLGRSKTIACPSLVDAAPAVLFEASAMGCNVVASANCGNWRLCNDQLVAQECSFTEFSNKIQASLAAPYQDNRQLFRGGYDYVGDVLRAM